MLLDKNILLVDARNIIDRIWYASKNEESTINLFLSKIDKSIKEYCIDYVLIAFDGKNTVRHKFFDEYKSKREIDEDKEKVVEKIYNIVKNKYCTIKNDNYEADDIIASIVTKMKFENDSLIFILSSDKDLRALVDETVFTVDIFKNTIYNINEVKKSMGVFPYEVTDLLSLMGDQSDGIPGAKGIGKITATTLINQYSSLKNIFDNIDSEDMKESIRKKLKNEIDNIKMSYKLVKLIDKIFENYSNEELKSMMKIKNKG